MPIYETTSSCVGRTVVVYYVPRSAAVDCISARWLTAMCLSEAVPLNVIAGHCVSVVLLRRSCRSFLQCPCSIFKRLTLR